MFWNPWYTTTTTGFSSALARSKIATSPESSPPPDKLQSDEQSLWDAEKTLDDVWNIHTTPAGRLYYCNRRNQTSSWVPPPSDWDTSHSSGVPYGWEIAYDTSGREYFINHVNKTTTYEDPRKGVQDESPQPRDIVLGRHSELGFGFVAGSEKPVIVRFVTEGGPSVDKLLPGDQIWMINGEDVRKAPREHVIKLVRSCQETVRLTVCQPPLDNSSRKSALLSAAKKAKLKSNPSRVRFAEGVIINGPSLFVGSTINNVGNEGIGGDSSSAGESYVPLMPNVLKVFLENGQTKSFKYDGNTTVRDVLESLQQKLTVRCVQHFALVVEHVKSLRRNKLTILDPEDSLCKIAAQPGAHHLRCLFRVTFVPRDSCELLRKDPIAFEYLYSQCCNDVVHERFAPELKYDIALRLAALHIHQHALANNSTGKFSIKAIEKEFGLERFVPFSLVETMKRKELRKLLQHFLKSNAGLVPAGQKQLNSLQAKLHYLRIIGELPSYGAKCFATNLQDSLTECVLLVSPKYGLSRISNARNSVPIPVSEIESLISVEVSRVDDLSCHVHIKVKDPDRESIVFGLEEKDAEELALVLKGYYFLFTGQPLLVHKVSSLSSQSINAPPYMGQHIVQPCNWSYKAALQNPGKDNCCQVIDLTLPPPFHNSPTFSDQTKMTGNEMIPSTGSPATITVKTGKDLSCSVDRNMNKMSASNMNVTHPAGSPGVRRQGLGSVGKLSSGDSSASNNHHPHSPSRSPRANKRVMDTVMGLDLQSIISPGSLEKNDSETLASATKEKTHLIMNDERALKRVAEMKQLVEDAENYLSDQESFETGSLRSSLSQTDSDISSSTLAPLSNFTQFRHSDSLLLLTQSDRELSEAVNIAVEQIKAMAIGETEPSESDTDSINTPTESPSRRPVVRPLLKASDSSFGLHSPDTFPNGSFRNQEIQEILRKLQDENTFPCNFAEGTLYLDPDIIDLTMIPPPLTPEEEGYKGLPNPLSTPPTPFADRLSFETELIEMKLAKEEMAKSLYGMHQFWDLNYHTNSNDLSATKEIERDDFLSVSCSTLSDDNNCRTENGGNAWMDQDIDDFISMTTMPPPPQLSHVENQTNRVQFDSDISSLIIPPPPHGASNDKISNDQLRSLADVKVSPRIALLQHQLRNNGTDAPLREAPKLSTNNTPTTTTVATNTKSEDIHSKVENTIICEDDSQTSKLTIAQRRAIFLGMTPSTTEPSTKNHVNTSRESEGNSGRAIVKNSAQLQLSERRMRHFIDKLPPDLSLDDSNHMTQYADAGIIRESCSLSTSSEELCIRIGSGRTSSEDSLDSSASCSTVKPADEDEENSTTENVNSRHSLSSSFENTSAVSSVEKPSEQNNIKCWSMDANGSPSLSRNSKTYNPSSNGTIQEPGTFNRKQIIDGHINNGIINFTSVNTGRLSTGSAYQKLSSERPGMVQNGHIMNGSLKDGSSHSEYNHEKLRSTLDARRSYHSIQDRYGVALDEKQCMIAYGTVDDILSNVVQRLDEIIEQCGAAHTAGGGIYMNDDKFQGSKEALAIQARNLVSSSKLFVKYVTEDCNIIRTPKSNSHGNGPVQVDIPVLKERLDNCVTVLEKMTEISEDVVHYTTTPLQTQNLLIRVRAVAHAFRLNVQAASQILVQKSPDKSDCSMGPLMERATLLAADLSALLRTLRVFPP